MNRISEVLKVAMAFPIRTKHPDFSKLSDFEAYLVSTGWVHEGLSRNGGDLYEKPFKGYRPKKNPPRNECWITLKIGPLHLEGKPTARHYPQFEDLPNIEYTFDE